MTARDPAAVVRAFMLGETEGPEAEAEALAALAVLEQQVERLVEVEQQRAFKHDANKRAVRAEEAMRVLASYVEDMRLWEPGTPEHRTAQHHAYALAESVALAGGGDT